MLIGLDPSCRGSGRALLDWCEARARERGLRRYEQAIGERRRAPRAALLRCRGYERVRSYWRMEPRRSATSPSPPQCRCARSGCGRGERLLRAQRGRVRPQRRVRAGDAGDVRPQQHLVRPRPRPGAQPGGRARTASSRASRSSAAGRDRSPTRPARRPPDAAGRGHRQRAAARRVRRRRRAGPRPGRSSASPPTTPARPRLYERAGMTRPLARRRLRARRAARLRHANGRRSRSTLPTTSAARRWCS